LKGRLPPGSKMQEGGIGAGGGPSMRKMLDCAMLNAGPVDVWSCGVVLMWCCAGWLFQRKRWLYYGGVYAQLCDPHNLDTLWDTYDAEWPAFEEQYPNAEPVGESLRELLSGMLCTDPGKRLTAAQVLEHQWMTEGRTLSGQQAGAELIVRNPTAITGCRNMTTVYFKTDVRTKSEAYAALFKAVSHWRAVVTEFRSDYRVLIETTAVAAADPTGPPMVTQVIATVKECNGNPAAELFWQGGSDFASYEGIVRDLARAAEV